MAADSDDLRATAEAMKARLNGGALDLGWVNPQNMRRFVEGCLSLLNELEQTMFMFACTVEAAGGSVLIEPETLRRVQRDAIVSRQDIADGAVLIEVET